MQNWNLRKVAIGVIVAALVAACGGDEESGQSHNDGDVAVVTISPSVETTEVASTLPAPTPTTTEQAIADTTTTTTTPPPDLDGARTSWNSLTGSAANDTIDPFINDGDILAVAHKNDLEASDPFGGFVVHRYSGEQWREVAALPSTDCAAMPMSCTLDLIGRDSARPVVFAAWCCPMGDPRGGGPVATAWQVTGDRVVPAVMSEEVFFGGVPADDSWSVDECSAYWSIVANEYECMARVLTTYVVEGDGRVRSDIGDEAPTGAVLTTCIASAGDRCAEELTIKYDSRCTDGVSYTNEFSLEACEFSPWQQTAESRLVQLGYAITDDGFYHPDEVAAVKAFQSDNGLDADGYIGPGTWRTLLPYLVCGPTPGSCDDTNGDGVTGPGDIAAH